MCASSTSTSPSSTLTSISALPLVGDARAALEELVGALAITHTDADYQHRRAPTFNADWDAEVDRIYNLEHEPLLSQGEVIGVVNTFSRPQDVVLCAAGSLPGDLHKLWRTREPQAAITSNMATRAWAMRSRVGWASKMADAGARSLRHGR